MQGLVDKGSACLSVRRQCALLGLSRSRVYYQAKAKPLDEVDLLNRIRDIWQRWPFYGYRRITQQLRAEGVWVNRKRVQRLMRAAGIMAIHPAPNTSRSNKAHTVYPYLLKDLAITRANQVWQVDITYLRMGHGFMYLVALIDVYSRYVVSWTLSHSLAACFCVEALNKGLAEATPDIINSDQGSQFTGDAWVHALGEQNIDISMTGKGRCCDNIYIERFWRSFKQEEFYLNDYENVAQLKQATEAYIDFYNHQRWHQSLDYKTPADVYFDKAGLNVVYQVAA